MSHQERYDIEAGKNVLSMLKQTMPREHARLMAQLRNNVGLAGLGTAEESEPGFWDRIFSAGAGALSTIVDYKFQEQQNKQQQEAYQDAAGVEMERQALLAAQRKTQVLEYTNQMELQRQQAELLNAAQRSKSKLNWALIAVGGLVGLFVLGRVLA